MNRQNHTSPYRQRGSALIISLVILIVMTLIGITGISTSSLDEKMAGNARDQALAFQAAEAALREGETVYNNLTQPSIVEFDGTTNGQLARGTNPDIFAGGTWDNAIAYTGGTIANVTEQPEYIIEFLGRIQDANTGLIISGFGESNGLPTVVAARVTARAAGGTNNAIVNLQTNFGRMTF